MEIINCDPVIISHAPKTARNKVGRRQSEGLEAGEGQNRVIRPARVHKIQTGSCKIQIQNRAKSRKRRATNNGKAVKEAHWVI